MVGRRSKRSAKLQPAFGTPKIWMQRLRLTEAAINITRKVPARNTKRTATSHATTKVTRVTRRFTSSRKAIRAIMIRRDISTSTTKPVVKKIRNTKNLVIMVKHITARTVKKTRNSARRESIRRDIARKESTSSLKKMNTRRNMIFTTSTTKTEEAKSTVVGMKNTRARRVVMKRKDIYMRDIKRIITVRRRSVKEVIIIIKRRVTNQPWDTTVITITTRDTAIKVVTLKLINGQNQTIVNEETCQTRRTLHILYLYSLYLLWNYKTS